MDVAATLRLDLGRLVNFGLHKGEPIHRWFCFRHSFSTELVREIIEYFGLKSTNSRILDPFCGSGTTLLACQEQGMASEGVDRLPFSVFVSKVKTQNYCKSDLLKAYGRVSFQVAATDWERYYEVPLIRKAFSPEMLQTVLGLRDEIERIDASRRSRDFLKLCWYSVLEESSQTVKDGAFLRVVSKQTSPDGVKRLFGDHFRKMFEDVLEGNRSKTQAWCGDSRRLPTRLKLAPYDAVITSPPYPNRHDYTRIYALELLLGDAVGTNDALKELRYQTLRSHVEARKAFPSNGYVPPERLVALLDKNTAGSPYDNRNRSMLEGYFEDMYLVLGQLFERCRSRARVAMVVSDVRFAGVTIPVGEILCDLADTVGFREQEIWILRYRGNTPQQLKSFPKERTTESVIMFTRP